MSFWQGHTLIPDLGAGGEDFWREYDPRGYSCTVETPGDPADRSEGQKPPLSAAGGYKMQNQSQWWCNRGGIFRTSPMPDTRGGSLCRPKQGFPCNLHVNLVRRI